MAKALGGLAVVLAFLAAIVAAVFGMIRGSDACTLAMEQARASAQVKERLGEPLEMGLFVSGNISTSGPSGRAELSIPVSGPKGRGKLFAREMKSLGEWHCDALLLAVEGDSRRIDLLAEKAQSPQPTTP